MAGKRLVTALLTSLGVDHLFRRVNRDRVLVLMYHAITDQLHHPPVWTHLPVACFRQQLEFLKTHYQVIGLDEFLEAQAGRTALPPRSALITFDDGYRNNYRVAFPVLRELELQSTVFLTVDRIGKRQLLWLDELYLHLSAPGNRDAALPLPTEDAFRAFQAGLVGEAYHLSAERLKLTPPRERAAYLENLRRVSRLIPGHNDEDFQLLEWDEVVRMRDSGLVSFGVHTATHRILSELEKSEWDAEIAAPKRKLEEILGAPQTAFCFPNGRPGVDYRPEHLAYLSSLGYHCAFTTRSGLHRSDGDDLFQVPRIAAGNDVTSEPEFFRLNTSGFIPWLRDSLGRSA
ncbi:polysaccharide deacetylase [Geomonas limicola]|uniref:Polysaccharide deacetylase n=1 Tax=Geomonas limicola TaxID=2740186 RepID=A0A6V8N227_9BACT|nr:polysaccharide deacetylase family protein [Geomonas limicola]GFO66556.1 polysaccharide deacetylase [Geomonas limicola]